MKTSHYKSKEGMPQEEFNAKFYHGAFFYTNCYMQYLNSQNIILTGIAQEIHNELSNNKAGTVPKLTVWKYIDFISSAIELFDDLALLVFHSANNILSLQESIERDTKTGQNFYHIGSRKGQFLSKTERSTLIAKALQIHDYSTKTWYKQLSYDDRVFVKELLRKQVACGEAVFSGLQHLQDTFRIVHNKSKHSAGCIFIPDTVGTPNPNPTWSILITPSITDDKKKRIGVPMSVEMLDVFCEAINVTAKLLVTICNQNMVRMRSFDTFDLPAYLITASKEDGERYNALVSPHSNTFRLVDLTMTFRAKMKPKTKSFYTDPKGIWADYFKAF